MFSRDERSCSPGLAMENPSVWVGVTRRRISRQENVLNFSAVLGPLNRFPNVMFHLQSLFKWSQFSVVYDKRDPYRAVAEALYEKKSIENMDHR